MPGGAIWIKGGKWRAVILGESNPKAFLDILSPIRDLDILVPWPAQTRQPVLTVNTPEEMQRQIAALHLRITEGANGQNV